MRDAAGDAAVVERKTAAGEGRGSGRTGVCLLVTLLATILATPLPAAHAAGLEEFERARRAYERHDYELAVERFKRLVGGETPRLRSQPLVLESRKYLAASYLFLGKRAAAKKQFKRLLRSDESYALDPAAFPSEVHDVFAEAKEEFEQRREQRRARKRQQVRELRDAQRRWWQRERARFERLQELAARETVVQRNSRWLALLPFGVGQLQNGHRRLGLTLAITEGLLAVASVTSFVGHEVVRDDAERGVPRAGRVADRFRLVNWISSGLLAGIAVGGIIDAQVRYRPVIRSQQKRPLPEDLQKTPNPPPGLDLSLTPPSLRVHF